MPERREVLTNISISLQQVVPALQALTQPGDEHLPFAMRHLLDAIDRLNFEATDDLDRRAAS